MKREEMIKKIKDWAAPLGPLEPVIDTFEDYINLNNERYSTIEEDSIDVLFDILLNLPKYDDIKPISSEDFNSELVNILTFIGQKDTKKFLIKLKDMINFSKSRLLIIDIIGGLKDIDGIELLKLLSKGRLTDDEIIHLADSLSEIRGLEAKEMLEDFKIKYRDRSLEVVQEIDICLNYF